MLGNILENVVKLFLFCLILFVLDMSLNRILIAVVFSAVVGIILIQYDGGGDVDEPSPRVNNNNIM